MSDEWMGQAACVGEDPRWWELADDVSHDENRMAVRICAGCPVKDDCYNAAVEEKAQSTIRGAVRFRSHHGKKAA